MSLKISNFSLTKSNSFVELSPKGLFMYNSPSEFIKFGTGTAEIKTPSLRVVDLIITGNLYVYGQQVSSGLATDISATSSDIFTIGSAVVSGDTTLKLGNYSTTSTLTANGTNITSSVPLSAPSIVKNGNEVFSTITAELFTLDIPLSTGVPIEIPNEKSYIQGTNKLLVFLDGRLLMRGATEDYTEVSSTQVAFNFDIAPDAKILFLIIG